jgi:hypothetical protein
MKATPDEIKAIAQGLAEAERAERLWKMLDDISTLDDACGDDDAAFRKRAYAIAERRHGELLSDGYTLTRPKVESA